MKEMLQKLREASVAAILQADDITALENLRVKYLGKKGELTAILKQMGRLSAEERPAMGQLANQVRAELEEEALAGLRESAYDTQLAQWVEEANVTYHREALEGNA